LELLASRSGSGSSLRVGGLTDYLLTLRDSLQVGEADHCKIK
jgi:hypothetical protein